MRNDLVMDRHLIQGEFSPRAQCGQTRLHTLNENKGFTEDE